MKKQNPLTILEQSLQSLKSYIDNQMDDSEQLINADYILQLKKESSLLLQFCKDLNQDSAFVQKVNKSLVQNNQNNLLIKTEHFFLSDIVNFLQSKNLNQKQLFAFAYIYDVLRNEIFADEKAVNTLNRLVSSNEFKKNIEQLQVQ